MVGERVLLLVFEVVLRGSDLRGQMLAYHLRGRILDDHDANKNIKLVRMPLILQQDFLFKAHI